MKVTMDGDDGSKSELQKKVEHDGYAWDTEMGMPEHRAVATRLLRRTLDTNEHIHHCNHVKHDNEPYNLFILSPAIHDIVHIATLILPGRGWKCGHELMRAEVLSKFLKDEGIPHIWLKEVEDEHTGN